MENELPRTSLEKLWGACRIWTQEGFLKWYNPVASRFLSLIAKPAKPSSTVNL